MKNRRFNNALYVTKSPLKLYLLIQIFLTALHRVWTIFNHSIQLMNRIIHSQRIIRTVLRKCFFFFFFGLETEYIPHLNYIHNDDLFCFKFDFATFGLVWLTSKLLIFYSYIMPLIIRSFHGTYYYILHFAIRTILQTVCEQESS